MVTTLPKELKQIKRLGRQKLTLVLERLWRETLEENPTTWRGRKIKEVSDTLRISQLTQKGYSGILPNSFFMLFLFLFLEKQFVNLQPFLVMILIKCYLYIIFIILIIFIVYLFDLCYVQPISSIEKWQPVHLMFWLCFY